MRGFYLSIRGKGHPAESSGDNTPDNANVKGDESTVRAAPSQDDGLYVSTPELLTDVV